MSHNNKYSQKVIVDAYILAKDGFTDEQVAGSLGVSGTTFRRWVGKYPTLAYALQRAREDSPDTFQDYIYSQLSDELRDVWDEIMCVLDDGGTRDGIEAILKNQGTRARQQLFIHSLTQTNFNVSESLRRVNISLSSLEHWKKTDPDFLQLFEEINFHKDNFFENAFMRSVARGDTSTIVHAAKTKLRHRGYNDKIEVELSGHVEQKVHHTYSIMDLDLDTATMRKILDAMRAKQQAEAV